MGAVVTYSHKNDMSHAPVRLCGQPMMDTGGPETHPPDEGFRAYVNDRIEKYVLPTKADTRKGWYTQYLNQEFVQPDAVRLGQPDAKWHQHPSIVAMVARGLKIKPDVARPNIASTSASGSWS